MVIWFYPEQRVWSGNLRACGTFLHSPLLEELKSLQAMMEAHLPNQAALRGTLERQRTISVELGKHPAAMWIAVSNKSHESLESAFGFFTTVSDHRLLMLD